MLKLRNQMQNLEKANANLRKRALEGGSAKGGGKQRRQRGNAAGAKGAGKGPKEFAGLPTRTPQDENICYAWNITHCPLAKAGERCHKGWHLCPRCCHSHPGDAMHALHKCPRG